MPGVLTPGIKSNPIQIIIYCRGFKPPALDEFHLSIHDPRVKTRGKESNPRQ